MFIEKIESGFTNTITIGKYCKFVFTKKNGVFMNVEEIFNSCQGFFHIVILGEDDPMLQRDEVARLCKRLIKDNPNIRLEIHTTAVNKPLEFNYYKDNVIFYVYTSLDITKLKEEIITFYVEVNSNFIFNIDKVDDIDTVVMITSAFGIKKSQTFLSTHTNINLLQYAKINGFSMAPIIEW